MIGDPTRLVIRGLVSARAKVGLPLATGEVMVAARDLVMANAMASSSCRERGPPRSRRAWGWWSPKRAKMHPKLAAGEIRSLLDRYPKLRSQIACVD